MDSDFLEITEDDLKGLVEELLIDSARESLSSGAPQDAADYARAVLAVSPACSEASQILESALHVGSLPGMPRPRSLQTSSIDRGHEAEPSQHTPSARGRLLRRDLEEFARRVRQARERLGLTPEDVAARTGLPAKRLSRLEAAAGHWAVPSAFLVARLAKALGQPVEHFLQHVHSEEDLMDAELLEAEELGELRELGLAFSGFSPNDFEAKRDALRVLRASRRKGRR